MNPPSPKTFSSAGKRTKSKKKPAILAILGILVWNTHPNCQAGRPDPEAHFFFLRETRRGSFRGESDDILDCGQQTKGEGWVANKWYLGRFFWKGGQKNLIKKVTTFYWKFEFLVSLNFHEATIFREPTFHEFKISRRKRQVCPRFQISMNQWTNKQPTPSCWHGGFSDPPSRRTLRFQLPCNSWIRRPRRRRQEQMGWKRAAGFVFLGGWVG